jgi:hypothetical protein
MALVKLPANCSALPDPIAQAPSLGRSAFNLGFVPHCFSPHFVVPISLAVWIVFNCSNRPFCHKTSKNGTFLGKTIKTIISRPAARLLKNR